MTGCCEMILKLSEETPGADCSTWSAIWLLEFWKKYAQNHKYTINAQNHKYSINILYNCQQYKRRETNMHSRLIMKYIPYYLQFKWKK